MSFKLNENQPPLLDELIGNGIPVVDAQTVCEWQKEFQGWLDKLGVDAKVEIIIN